MSLKLALVASAAIIATAGTAAAQDYSLAPAFGQANLSSGFSPDPYVVNMTAGGNIDASSALGGSCRGMIANAPDFRLTYQAGSVFSLYIGAVSSSDTTIVVNAPDGSWYCNDDGGEGLNPLVSFGSPMSGQYDIWVGTYGVGSDLAQAQIRISELGG